MATAAEAVEAPIEAVEALKSMPTAFSTNESKSATRNLRQLARSARRGAREVPHGLRAQQTVTMASMGGGEERERTPRELLMACGSFSAQLDPLPGLLRLDEKETWRGRWLSRQSLSIAYDQVCSKMT